MSEQDVPAGLNVSDGQAAVVPVHFSSLSQSPADALQICVVGLNVSDGQSNPEPEQYSALSQSPADALQIVVVGEYDIVPVVPLQYPQECELPG